MTLFRWVRDYIKKYSFVEKTIFKNGRFFIYYTNGEFVKKTSLPYRSTKEQLVSKIEWIKKQINYKEIKSGRDKKVKKELEKDKDKVPIVRFN